MRARGGRVGSSLASTSSSPRSVKLIRGLQQPISAAGVAAAIPASLIDPITADRAAAVSPRWRARWFVERLGPTSRTNRSFGPYTAARQSGRVFAPNGCPYPFLRPVALPRGRTHRGRTTSSRGRRGPASKSCAEPQLEKARPGRLRPPPRPRMAAYSRVGASARLRRVVVDDVVQVFG